MPQPRSEAGMGLSLSQRPQAYLKKSAPGETAVSMLRTSGSCSGDSVAPPAWTGAAPSSRRTATAAAAAVDCGNDEDEVLDRVIRVPFAGRWVANAAHIRAHGPDPPAGKRRAFPSEQKRAAPLGRGAARS